MRTGQEPCSLQLTGQMNRETNGSWPLPLLTTTDEGSDGPATTNKESPHQEGSAGGKSGGSISSSRKVNCGY